MTVKTVTVQPSCFVAACNDLAGIQQPVKLWSQEMTQTFMPRFHFGVDFGLPMASRGTASFASRARACATMFGCAAGAGVAAEAASRTTTLASAKASAANLGPRYHG